MQLVPRLLVGLKLMMEMRSPKAQQQPSVFLYVPGWLVDEGKNSYGGDVLYLCSKGHHKASDILW